MRVNEEVLDIASLKDRTTGKDIKEVVIKCAEDRQLDLKSLIGIATDEAPLMIGKNIGAAILLPRYLEDLRNCSSAEDGMFICHCFLQLKNLCAQVLDMSLS